ncbi:hypothetical protein EBB59_08590 [Lysobacter pythonis]|uniref:Lytic enzyme n=1 Tax=Solilutibacter pythonis TaxID=2483112 RepID=A0A3M2HMR0_9GAMM|nr:peptidoglycan-binding protein [Lysobacter pythonis]RMH90996.1 hypothetical protein EBB59_08590 [Lysobacter pythonis]
MSKDREQGLLATAVANGITSPRELANFMAQVGHESSGLNRLEESFRYTRSVDQIPVKSAFREGRSALESARLEAMNGKPEKLAELMYGGRMGNDEPGDGYLYRGRGYIQLTGKDNYRKAGEALGIDFVGSPDLAAQPENAEKIAVWYWKTRVPEASREDVRVATRAINGGLNGLADREQRFGRWEKAITAERIEQIKEGRLGQSIEMSPAASKSTRQSAEPTAMDARAVQASLATLGYLGKDGKPLAQDGIQGQNTEHAVRIFQQSHGLSVDGTVGPQTLKALEHAKAHPFVTEVNHPNHMLYRAIAERLPPGTDPRVTANVTLQAMENGVDHPSKLREVLVNGNDVWVLSTSPDPAQRARVDLQAPTPDMQSMSDHMAKQSAEQQLEQQRAQQMNVPR